MTDDNLFLALSDPRTARRLRIVRAYQCGMKLDSPNVTARFAVSKATAKRDVAAVKRVLANRPAKNPSPVGCRSWPGPGRAGANVRREQPALATANAWLLGVRP